MMIFFSISLFFIFSLPLVSQPLALGFSLMCVSVCFSVILGVLNFSFYGFILFLVYVGGLLVMFGYVVVLIPNMIFSSSFFVLFYFLFFFSSSWFFFDFFFFFDSFSFLFSYYGFFIYLGLALVLLFCLLVVVKICYFHSGSLRPFFSLY